MLGGGAGHIMDMISRLKANDAMRRKRSYFKIKKDYLDTAKGMKITYREATNEDGNHTYKNQRAIKKRKKGYDHNFSSFAFTYFAFVLDSIYTVFIVNVLST